MPTPNTPPVPPAALTGTNLEVLIMFNANLQNLTAAAKVLAKRAKDDDAFQIHPSVRKAAQDLLDLGQDVKDAVFPPTTTPHI
ncbi:MAG TPA: hypothetical protein VM120_17930 [Bryobacteraceae bacterium]|nr:hypothetical protein [Bryobacteraceae bacterium]